MRLQRFLSMAGLASRREAEKMIEEGHVEVNGSIATLGSTVDPAADRVSVDGRKVAGMAGLVYLVLNKPRDVLSTRSDPDGRRTVMEFLPPDTGMVMPVGRLDYHSTGLLLMTNDGDLAQRLTRPDSQVAKVYRVKATRTLAPEDAERFRNGVPLDGRRTRPAELKLLQESPGVWYQAVLSEGRNRQIRRMFQALGNGVQKLCRTAIGPISLGKLPSGEVRALTEREVLALKRAAGMPVEQSRLDRKAGWAVAKPRREMPGRKRKRPEPAVATKRPVRTPRGKGR
jgi:23S rRNA pseudouridine2605 synthase